jgi:hypothetical protein
MSSEIPGLDDISFDGSNIYKEENLTDLKVGSIRMLTPIKADGSVDESRKPTFMAQTHIMSGAGPVPVNSEIEAENLEDAIKKFPEAIKAGVNKMLEEVKEYQRKEASKIVVPDASAASNIQI